MQPGVPFDPETLDSELRRTGALLEGHFALSSGLHSLRYIQCARLLQYPDLAQRAGQAVAALFGDGPLDTVVSPALGGLILGHEVGRALGIRALFAERVEALFRLRRGFEIKDGERVLLVEDVLTTGRSVGELATVVRGYGADIRGIAALVDRGVGELDLDLPVRALLRITVPRYAPEECPACRSGIPVEKPGSRPASQLRKNT